MLEILRKYLFELFYSMDIILSESPMFDNNANILSLHLHIYLV